jgi:hypothetical protein
MRDILATEAAQLEAERRVAHGRVAGRVAAASPLHVSNRRKVEEATA